MPQQTGRVTIKLGSDSLRSKPGASLQPGGVQRDFEASDQGESYYKEKIVPSQIRATLVHMTDTDVSKLLKWKDGTAFFETDTGHVFTVANAATANLGELSNGELPITIGGDPASE